MREDAFYCLQGENEHFKFLEWEQQTGNLFRVLDTNIRRIKGLESIKKCEEQHNWHREESRVRCSQQSRNFETYLFAKNEKTRLTFENWLRWKKIVFPKHIKNDFPLKFIRRDKVFRHKRFSLCQPTQHKSIGYGMETLLFQEMGRPKVLPNAHWKTPLR